MLQHQCEFPQTWAGLVCAWTPLRHATVAQVALQQALLPLWLRRGTMTKRWSQTQATHSVIQLRLGFYALKFFSYLLQRSTWASQRLSIYCAVNHGYTKVLVCHGCAASDLFTRPSLGRRNRTFTGNTCSKQDAGVKNSESVKNWLNWDYKFQYECGKTSFCGRKQKTAVPDVLQNWQACPEQSYIEACLDGHQVLNWRISASRPAHLQMFTSCCFSYDKQSLLRA